MCRGREEEEGRKAIQLPLARSVLGPLRWPGSQASTMLRPTNIQAQAWHSAWRRRLAFGCQIDMIVELANWNWLGREREEEREERGIVMMERAQ